MSLQQTDGIGWLAANSVRNYPLDDSAGKIASSGRQLPDSILADLHLWFPEEMGTGASISAVAVSPGLVSITIEATGGSGLQPLATLSVTKPVDPYRNYPLRAAADGVGGWVTFGPSVNDVPAGTWLFTDLTQSKLLPRTCRPYPTAGVTSIQKNGVPGRLTGVVQLRSGNSGLVTVEKGRETLNGEERDCIVVKLNESSEGAEVYEKFSGPCGGTLESQDCQRESPIFSINGVTPCCSDGLLIIDVVEVGVEPEDSDLYFSWSDTRSPAGEEETPTGTVLGWDYNVGMSDICVKGLDGFTVDQVDNCDTDGQCAEWEDVSSLPTLCAELDGSGFEEAGWPDSDDEPVHYSDAFSLDLDAISGVRVEGLNEGFLFLIDAAASVTHSSGTWTIPAAAIGLENNKGFLLHNAAQVYGPVTQVSYPASSEKTFEHTGTAGSVIYPEGDETNHGSGTAAELVDIDVVMRMFNTVITKAELLAVSATGQFKLAHVASGYGSFSVQFWCFPAGGRVDNGEGNTEGGGVGGGAPATS